MYLLIALNLKEIPYDIKPVSLVKSGGEQHSNEFREINPMEQVPALHIDNHTLIESVSKFDHKHLCNFCDHFSEFIINKFFNIAEYSTIFGGDEAKSSIDAGGSCQES